MSALVVGVGNDLRGDDGVGPAVARAVAALNRPGVRVLESVEPTRLVEAWAGSDQVVVVDAMRATAAAGGVAVLDALARPLPAGAGSAGTHAFGLAAAVELARVLGRLPRRLAVVGVAAGDARVGAPLSAAARERVPAAVAAVLGLLDGREVG